MPTDTIFALSSGNPPAAIALVRISGPRADRALAALSNRALPAPRHAALRTLQSDVGVLDSALVIRFPAPGSATGEDLVELHLHGGRATVAAICDALGHLPGLRPAEPGEFTRRAFANGRLDLSAAEGLSDLLRAETEGQRRAALAMASGGLGTIVNGLQAEILNASARIEAALDFDDEDDVVPWPARAAVLIALADQVAAQRANPPAERLHNGVRVAIAGPPNAGKSSLINALGAREAAIVSPVAGTTRDVIEVPVHVRGLPLVLIDTAGLRASTGKIEALGVARAAAVIDAADIVVWLGAPDLAPDRPNVIVVRAKADLAAAMPGDTRLGVSSTTSVGLSELLDCVATTAHTLLPPADTLALNQRQRQCLADIESACRAAAATDDLLIAAEHLRHARAALDRLTGQAGVEDMLDALFGTFCIGK